MKKGSFVRRQNLQSLSRVMRQSFAWLVCCSSTSSSALLIAFATSQGLDEGMVSSRHEINSSFLVLQGVGPVKKRCWWSIYYFGACFYGPDVLLWEKVCLLGGAVGRKPACTCMHSPALAVAVKQMTSVSAITFGSKCHNSLTREQSAHQHGCCVQALHKLGRSMAVMWSIPLGSTGLGNAVDLKDYAELCSLSMMFQIILS